MVREAPTSCLRDDCEASEESQEWLDVQSRFHDYTYRNTLLKAAVSRGEPGCGLPDVAGEVRSPRHGGRVGHLDLGADYHEAVPGVRELAELPRGQ